MSMTKQDYKDITAYLQRYGYTANYEDNCVIVIDPVYSSLTGHTGKLVALDTWEQAFKFVSDRD